MTTDAPARNQPYYVFKLPFGEVISAGVGGRSQSQGYVDSSVRQGFTGYERDAETDLDFAQARMYNKNHGRFTSVDPIFMKEDRLLDPQAINLYAYVRNNPLVLIDPTGLDFEFKGKDKDKFVEDVNNRDDAQFKVNLNKNGILEVVDKDKVDVSKLNESEKAFFDAINDTENRAVLNGIDKSPEIDFGGFRGNGQNDIDTSDMALLRKADKNLAGNVIAHEMMESYASSKSKSNDFDAMHNEASKSFPGAINTDARPLRGEENSKVLSGAVLDYTVTRNGRTRGMTVEYESLQKTDFAEKLPLANITKITVLKKK